MPNHRPDPVQAPARWRALSGMSPVYRKPASRVTAKRPRFRHRDDLHPRRGRPAAALHAVLDAARRWWGRLTG